MATPLKSGPAPATTGVTDALATFRRPGTLFLVAGAVWIIGVIFETLFVTTDTLADGAAFVISELIFYAAMGTFAWALFSSATRRLAGPSRAGRVGLIITALAMTGIMATGILVNFFEILALHLGILVFALLRDIGGITAGVAIMRRSPIPAPARATFLVYALATALLMVLFIFPEPTPPTPLAEACLGAMWMVIGLSLLRPRPASRNRTWFWAGVGICGIAIAITALPGLS